MSQNVLLNVCTLDLLSLQRGGQNFGLRRQISIVVNNISDQY